jgi:cystathionine beta-lyase
VETPSDSSVSTVPGGGLRTPLDELDVASLRRRTSLKWRQYGDDVLPLWVAEMDVRQCDAVRSVLVDAVEAGDTGYPHGQGYQQALSDFASDRWGWDFPPTRSRLVADVMTGVAEVVKVVTAPGDPVVVTPPVYGPFFDFVTATGRRIVHAPLAEDHRFDLDRLDAAFREAAATAERAAAFLLCNPHNPTGVAWSRDELTAVARIATRHGVRVVADEIHGPLTMPGTSFTSWLTVEGGQDGLVVTSASKSWNLAGLKAAVVVAGEDAVEDLRRLPRVVAHGPSHLGILAHTAALTAGRDWLDAVVAGIDRNHRLLGELVAERLPDVTCRRAEATYLAWLDFRRAGLGRDPARALRGPARVVLSDGLFFGPGGEGFARMNVATSAAIVEQAVDRIAGALDVARQAPG